MTTRSKLGIQDMKSPVSDTSLVSEIALESEIDDHGNIKGFIDYEEDEDFDQTEYDNVIRSLSGNKMPKKISKKIKKSKESKKDKKLNDVFMKYLILKATEKANEDMKGKNKKKKSKIRLQKNLFLKKKSI